MALKILMPIFNRVGKGTYWRARGYALELANRGHEVTLLGAGTPDQTQTEVQQAGQIKTVTITSRFKATQGSGYDPGDIIGRYLWSRRNQASYDLVHAFESRPTALVPALIYKRRGALFVSDWCDWFGRGGSVEQRNNPLARMLMRPVESFFENRSRPGADGVTVINNTLYHKALSLGVPAERLLLLPNGANTDEFKVVDRLAVRKRLGLPATVPLIAYTGSMFKSDAELMATAFNIIQEKIPEAKLLLIGYTNQDLLPLLDQPGGLLTTGQVTIQELADYVAASTVGWIPLADNLANAGRFPMKTNDFMASGRALVVTDVGDLGDVIKEHNLGLVAKAEPESIAQQVLVLLADTELREQIERQTRQVAETTYAWPQVTNTLEDFYYSLFTARKV